MNPQTQGQPEAQDLASKIARLAGIIGATHYPPGDRAALRRWAPGQTIPLSFYRLWLRHLDNDLPPEDRLDAWMTLAWGLATMGERAHRLGRSFGQALAEAGYAEGRLERLLAAPDALRNELFMSAVRFLAAKNESFDWTGAAAFLLASAPQRRNRIHSNIARDFYRYLPKNNRKE